MMNYGNTNSNFRAVKRITDAVRDSTSGYDAGGIQRIGDGYAAQGTLGADGTNAYLHALYCPFDVPPTGVPDFDSFATSAKKINYNDTFVSTGDLMFIWAYTSQKPMVDVFKNSLITNQFEYWKSITPDYDLSTNYRQGRPCAGALQIYSNTVASGTFEVSGTMTAVHFQDLPDVRTLNYQTLTSYSSNGMGVNTGVTDGTMSIMMPTVRRTELFDTPNTFNCEGIYTTRSTGGQSYWNLSNQGPGVRDAFISLDTDADSFIPRNVYGSQHFNASFQVTIANDSAGNVAQVIGRLIMTYRSINDAGATVDRDQVFDTVTSCTAIASDFQTLSFNTGVVHGRQGRLRSIRLEIINNGSDTIEFAPGPTLDVNDQYLSIEYFDLYNRFYQQPTNVVMISGIDPTQRITLAGVQHWELVPDSNLAQDVKTSYGWGIPSDVINARLQFAQHPRVNFSRSGYEGLKHSFEIASDRNVNNYSASGFTDFLKGFGKGFLQTMDTVGRPLMSVGSAVLAPTNPALGALLKQGANTRFYSSGTLQAKDGQSQMQEAAMTELEPTYSCSGVLGDDLPDLGEHPQMSPISEDELDKSAVDPRLSLSLDLIAERSLTTLATPSELPLQLLDKLPSNQMVIDSKTPGVEKCLSSARFVGIDDQGKKGAIFTVVTSSYPFSDTEYMMYGSTAFSFDIGTAPGASMTDLISIVESMKDLTSQNVPVYVTAFNVSSVSWATTPWTHNQAPNVVAETQLSGLSMTAAIYYALNRGNPAMCYTGVVSSDFTFGQTSNLLKKAKVCMYLKNQLVILSNEQLHQAFSSKNFEGLVMPDYAFRVGASNPKVAVFVAQSLTSPFVLSSRKGVREENAPVKKKEKKEKKEDTFDTIGNGEALLYQNEDESESYKVYLLHAAYPANLKKFIEDNSYDQDTDMEYMSETFWGNRLDLLLMKRQLNAMQFPSGKDAKNLKSRAAAYKEPPTEKPKKKKKTPGVSRRDIVMETDDF